MVKEHQSQVMLYATISVKRVCNIICNFTSPINIEFLIIQNEKNKNYILKWLKILGITLFFIQKSRKVSKL